MHREIQDFPLWNSVLSVFSVVQGVGFKRQAEEYC